MEGEEMEVVGILSNSVHYSSRLVNQFDKLFVLAVFAIIPVVNLLVLGYLARVIRDAPISSNPPPLESWGRMLVDGLTILVVSLVYLAAGIAVTIGLFYVGSAQMALLGTLVVFVGYILLPMAIVHSVRTGNPSKAFAIGEIMGRISERGTVDYFVLVAVIFILPMLVMTGLILIPFLGWFLGFLVSPAIGVFMARASALAYGM
jgi:hypothetical protein